MAGNTNTPARIAQGVNAVVLLAAPLAANATGSQTWIVVKNTKWELSPKSDNKKSANTTDGIIRAPGLHDYELSFEGDIDLDHPIELNIMPGVILDFRLGRTDKPLDPSATSGFWAGRVITGDGKFTGGAEDLYDFTFKGDKQSGVLTYPDGVTTW